VVASFKAKVELNLLTKQKRPVMLSVIIVTSLSIIGICRGSVPNI
jgi:hypothetical protein